MPAGFTFTAVLIPRIITASDILQRYIIPDCNFNYIILVIINQGGYNLGMHKGRSLKNLSNRSSK